MKTIEIINGKERRITPLTPLIKGVGGIVTNLQMKRNERLLPPEGRESLKAYREELRRIGEQEIARVRNDSRIQFQPVVIEGITYTTFGSAGIAYFKLRMRLEREAKARGDTQIDESQLPWPLHRLPEPEPPRTEEERRQRDIPIVRKVHAQLAKEVENAPFDQLAKLIKTSMWKDRNPLAPISSIQPYGELNVAVNDDGTVINRSRFGVSLSYTQDTDTGEPVRNIRPGKKQKPDNEIIFGVGYFDPTQVIPEARGFIAALPNGEREREVKAYFIQRKEPGNYSNTTYIIPLAYAESQKEFIEYLYEVAVLHSPRFVRLEARQRREKKYQVAA